MITNGTDKILLDTYLPSPYPDTISKKPLQASFDVEKGKGYDYAKTHFPNIPIKTLDVSTK